MTPDTALARRPRARNARPKIERAALKLFVDDGIDAATTRHIAEEAGVSEGALYRHYKGKDELALALFSETHERLCKRMVEAWNAGGDLEMRIAHAVAAYCELADEDWLRFSFHLLTLNRFLANKLDRARDPVSVSEAVIRNLMETSEIPAGNATLLAAMALGVLTQTAENIIYGRIAPPMSQYASALTRAILAILRQA